MGTSFLFQQWQTGRILSYYCFSWCWHSTKISMLSGYSFSSLDLSENAKLAKQKLQLVGSDHWSFQLKLNVFAISIYKICCNFLGEYCTLIHPNGNFLFLAKQPSLWRTVLGCLWWSRQARNGCRYVLTTSLCMAFRNFIITHMET